VSSGCLQCENEGACRCTRTSRRAAAGFTLFELLLVLAIVGVVSVIALPRFARSTAGYRAEMAARRAAADLEWVRRRARAAGSSRTIAFDANGGAYTIARMGDANDPNAGYVLDVRKTYDVGLSANFGGAPTLTFDGYGQSVTAGRVTFTAGAFQRACVLDAGGALVRVE
jgi:prepilin-type N-terminal cleavage/methylation domain-containing protein